MAACVARRAALVAALAPAMLALDNGLGLTPALAWSTWNRFLLDINETLVLEMADAIVSTGLRDAGFKFVNVDAGMWIRERDANGDLQVNPATFPSGIAALASKIHARGLKLGVYTDLATGSCGTGPGSGGGHYAQDAAFFARIGADYLKVDYCGSGIPVGAPELEAWGEFSTALNATGRPIYFSICPKMDLPANTTGPLTPYAGEQGLYAPPLEWSRADKRAVANAWLVEVRNNVDGWGPSTAACADVGAPCGMITNIDSQVALGKWAETGPGGLVDADMLEVCQFNGTVNHPGLTASEGRLHYYVWAVLPSPLILSFDARTLPSTPGGAECLAMVLNPEILAINQDPGVVGATLLAQGSVHPPWPANSSEQVAFQVFGRPLMGAGAAPGPGPAVAWAALLVNRSPAPLRLNVSWAALGLPQPAAEAQVRDVGARADLGAYAGGFSATVPPHDASFLRVTQVAVQK